MLGTIPYFATAQVKAKPKATPKTVTDTEISGGLKEALSNGIKFAVNSLGKENGYLGNARVKIPLPKSLQ